jgi:peptidoglycan/xylan/chitin deacetylase (PgdA/CDA1 family)
MAARFHVGKRELLARGLFWSGGALVMDQLPQQDQLMVLNYHRIGNADEDSFDPDLFAAKADEFDDQISCLKRHTALVTLEEALAFIEGAVHEKTPRCRVLVTFDDGYLDNYETAFPILRSHGVQGVFFLATGLVGSNCIPWWDRAAYLMKTARKRRFTLRFPVQLEIDLDKNDLLQSLRQVAALCYWQETADIGRFMRELAEAADAEEPAEETRRFLDWDEARRMIGGGMAIGCHTHSHGVLGRLPAEHQRRELSSSRELLRERLGVAADTLAYPYGVPTSFSGQTQELVREMGYRAAFSINRHTNLPGKTNPYSVNRICIGNEGWPRFRVKSAVCRLTGKYWP